MQCLFCGKELALLKRLRGGGEFCSEAHRNEYQQQYEQLALARLMQAKPPAEAASPLNPRNAPDPRLQPAFAEPAYAEPVYAEPAYSEEPAYTEELSPAPVAIMESPAPMAAQPTNWIPAEEDSPAPLAGFLSEAVIPAVTSFEQAGLLDLDNAWECMTSLPSFSALNSAAAFDDAEGSASSDSQACLPPAPRVELALSLQALEHHTRTSERGLELREFASSAPVIELQLRPGTGSEPLGNDDVMEILMSPHPPQKAKPWLGVPRGFPAAPAELGDLARLDFITTGFAYSDQAATAPQAAVLAPEVRQTPSQVRPEVPSRAPIQADPAPQAFVAPPEPVAPAEAVAAEPAPPELFTQALPVTLHGIAAVRGKLTQAFPSPLTAASDVQFPPSATLPLRPTIVFGPPPAAAAAPVAAPVAAPRTVAEPAPLKEVQARQVPVQPKPAQSKPVQSQPQERSRPSVVPAPKAVPVRRTAAQETPAPEKQAPQTVAPAAPVVNPRPETRQEFPVRQSFESSASEAAMPSLHLESSQSAWSKLSTGLKIGVAAALLAAVAGIGYVVTRGNGKSPAEAPAVVSSTPSVASGVAISGGWIDDWANAARSKRHISVLSGSAKLSDYRLEFQAQIETKAIGWIFRGLNPRNYYVTKLEVVTPGLEPTIALVHFAVVEGQDENRVVVPLPMKTRVDTTYKVRFEAFGNHFTTWVQDQKIAEWTDSRFGSGGVGFFSERDEKAAMQGTVNVVPLVPKN